MEKNQKNKKGKPHGYWEIYTNIGKLTHEIFYA